MLVKVIKRIGICTAVILVLLGYVFMDFLNFKEGAAPVLMYHGVGVGTVKEWGNLLVPPEKFEAQLQYLKDGGYTVVSVEELAERLATNKTVNKYVAFTFDDGYVNNYQYAFPLLKKYNSFATFYIIRNALDSKDYMSDTQIREMLKAGMKIGSHTMSHSNLKIIDIELYAREIHGSKMLLEQRFGTEVESISYPYGAYNNDVLKEVFDAGYKIGVAGKYGVNTVDSFNDNPYTMNRVGIFEDKTMDISTFAHILEQAYFVGYLRHRGIDAIELKKFFKNLLTF